MEQLKKLMVIHRAKGTPYHWIPAFAGMTIQGTQIFVLYPRTAAYSNY